MADIKPNFLTGFFSPEYILRKKEKLGEIPTGKTAMKSFFAVAWPAVLESTLIGLVGFIDTQMVSVLGTDSVAAVGITGQPRMLFYAVFFAINIGVTAIVSRRTGQGDRDGANGCLAQSVSLTLVLGILLCTAACLSGYPLLKLAGAEDIIIDDAVTYFRITMIGLLFTGIGMTINAAHRGSGNTRIAMTTNIIANIINCIFNYLLIGGRLGFPALGVKGAAIATLIGNLVSFCISFCTVFFNKTGYLHVTVKDCFKIRKDVLKLHARVSRNAAVEQLFLRFGFFITAIMINRLGTASVSCNTICMTILSLSFNVGDGLGVATSALVGLNLGKCRKDLSLMYGSIGQRVGLIMAAIIGAIFLAFGQDIVGMFVIAGDQNEEFIMSAGRTIMYIIAVTLPVQISMVVYSGCLRGAGDTLFVAVTSFVAIAVLRPLTTYLLAYTLGFGVIGAYLSVLIDHVFRLVTTCARFNGGKWSKVKI